MTFTWPFDFNPTIDRDKNEYPGETEIELVIEAKKKKELQMKCSIEGLHGKKSTPMY